jgi:DNA-binding transcriptional regulator YiaG
MASSSNAPVQDADAIAAAAAVRNAWKSSTEKTRHYPGPSKNDIRRRLTGRTERRCSGINEAIELGYLSEGAPQGPRRGGGLSLYPTSTNARRAEADPLEAAALREFRKRNGFDQASLAKKLRVSRSLVALWEQGRREIPAWVADAIGSASAGPAGSRRLTVQQAKNRLREELGARSDVGATKTELRELISWGESVGRALGAMLQAREVHARAVDLPGASSTTRYFLGPSPAAEEPIGPTGHDLGTQRRAANLTQAELARRLNVSESSVRNWEAQRFAVPASLRRPLRDLLESTGRQVTLRRGALGDEIEDFVGSQPLGVSLEQIFGRFGRTRAVADAVADVRSADRICEVRSGEKEHRRVLVATPLPDAVDLADRLRRAREDAELRQSQVAALIGVSNNAVSRWETGCRPIPIEHRAAVERVVAELEGGAHSIDREICEELERSGGMTREELTRGRFGRSARVLRAIDRLTEQGILEDTSELRKNAGGVQRAQHVLVLANAKRADRQPAHMSGDELRDARIRGRWSKRSLAAEIGVSKTAIADWEARGPNAIPAARTALVQNVLASPPPRDFREAVHLTDDELVDGIVASVASEPGLTGREVVKRLVSGEVRRRWRALDHAATQRRIEARIEPRIDSRGRSYPKRVFYPPH